MSAIVPPPVESSIGLPNAATCRCSGVLRISPDANLNAGTSSSASRSALSKSNAVAKNVIADLARVRQQLAVRVGPELERLAVLAVRAAEAELVVVRLLEEVARVERAVRALLQLDRVRATLLRSVDQTLRLLEVALMVVADLRDDVAGLPSPSWTPSIVSVRVLIGAPC